MASETIVIIVTFNGINYIQKCLESVRGYPVIIIDNHSIDGTVEYIKSNFKEIQILEQKKNLGFGQANNLGISLALKKGAKFIFLLNQDAYFKPDSLNLMMDLQLKNPEYGILSPIHLNGKGDFIDNKFSNYLQASPSLVSDLILNKALANIYNVPFVNAAGWLISRKCLETVGGFDPIFFHYGEDDNYCQRLNYHGLKIGIVPGIYLKHDRENRPAEKVLSKKDMEISLMVKYANVNLNNLLMLKSEKNKLEKAVLKSIIKLRFKPAKSYLDHVNLITRLLPEIVKSRKTNSEKGPHYLR